MITDKALAGSEKVRKFQRMLHLKAKEEPELRFHSLIDKVWRMDFPLMAWQAVRRNGGAAGVDGVSIADVESHGVEQWLGKLSQDLQAGAYAPQAVRQVLIPKKQRGKYRPLGIPCLRDRVAQASALLVPIRYLKRIWIRNSTPTVHSEARRMRLTVSTAFCLVGIIKSWMRTWPTILVKSRMLT